MTLQYDPATQLIVERLDDPEIGIIGFGFDFYSDKTFCMMHIGEEHIGIALSNLCQNKCVMSEAKYVKAEE